MKRFLFILILIQLQVLHTNCQTNPKQFSVLKGPYLGQKPPETTPDIFAPGLFSPKEFIHGSPVFSIDGNEIFFSGIKWMRNINEKWTNLEYVPFSGKFYDSNPIISPDGRKVIFHSYSAPDESLRERGIYIVERIGESWTKPVIFDGYINSIYGGWSVSISAKGNIYFHSRRIESGNSRYLFYKSEVINGKYQAPVKLRGKINNASAGELYISPEEDYIIFSSGRPGGEGKYDLYISFYQKDDSWGEGINLGKNINTNDDEMWPNVTPDKKYLFFIGVRSGKSNIYWVSAKIIEEKRPKG
jgi:Tol biopolymer transport system component